MKYIRGAAEAGLLVTIGIAIVAGVASYFTSVNAQNSNVMKVDQTVAVNSNRILTLENAYIKLESKLDTMNDKLNALLVKQGLDPLKIEQQ